MRRLPALVLVTPLLGLPALPSAQAADPPGSVEVAVVRTTDPLGATSQQVLPTSTGVRSAFPGDLTLSAPHASADGSRVVSFGFRSPPTSGEVKALDVQDIGGAVVRTVFFAPDDLADDVAISPDGNRIAYRGGFSDNAPYSGEVSDLATGERRVFRTAERIQSLCFLSNGVLLQEERVTEAPGPRGPADLNRFRLVSLTSRTAPVLVGLPDSTGYALSGFVVDLSGTRLAFLRERTSGVVTLEVAPLSVTGARVQVGTPRVLVTGAGQAAFSRDGTRLLFLQGGAVRAIPVGGGPVTTVSSPPPGSHDTSLAVGVRESVAPAAPRLGRPVPRGNNLTIPVLPAGDPTLSRYLVTRTAAGVPTKAFSVLAPTTVIADGGADIGRTYTYSVRAVDRSGNTGPATVTQVEPIIAPTLSAESPTSGASAVSGFPVGFGYGASPGTTFSVDVRTTGGWSRWLTRVPYAPFRTFGGPAASGVAATSAVPGQTYQFRGQAFDRFGNATAVRVSGLAVVPFDQTRLALAGSAVTVRRAGAYGGTVALLGRGATATTRLVGDRVQVVGERCPTCGVVDVIVDGVTRQRVDTYAPDRRVREVLFAQTYATGAARTVTLRSLGTSGRPTVVVDAIASRRFVPPSQLVTPQQLVTGQALLSVNHAYRAAVTGGRLVVQDVRGRVVFATPTTTGARLVVQRDGNLVLYPRAGLGVFQTGTGGYGPARLVLQDDGDLVLRTTEGGSLWSSRHGRAPYLELPFPI